MTNYTAQELYESTLYSLPSVFFNNPKDFVENFSTDESVYQCIMGLLLVAGEKTGTDVLDYTRRFSGKYFSTRIIPIYKSGIFKNKKIYNVITIELLGVAKTQEYKKLYFIYNDDYSEVYSCVAGGSPLDEAFSKLFGNTDDDLNITIYNKNNRILGTVSVNMAPAYNIREFGYADVKDLYEIFRKILNLGDDYRKKLSI